MEDKTTLEYYFGDMSKYPVLSTDEINLCAVEMAEAFDQLISTVLDCPAGWQFILDKWQQIRIEGKASNKLSEDYGSTSLTSKELSDHVDLCLDNAAKILYQIRMAQPDSESITKIQRNFRGANLSKRLYQKVAEFLLKRGNIANIEGYLGAIQENKDKMVNSNLRLVVNFAKKFPSVSVSLSDLIQEGNLGLIRAVEKYNPEKNIKFSTYAAWWIRQAFLRAVKSQGKTIRLPTHVYDSVTRLRRLQEEIKLNEMREASIAELADLIGVKESTVSRLLALQIEPISLTASVKRYSTDENPRTIGDFISSAEPLFQDEDLSNFVPQMPLDPAQALDDKKLKNEIQKQLKRLLTKTERDVIRWRYGLGKNETHTLEQIADKLGRSRERIRQIEAAAISKLRDKASLLGKFQDE
jgi:RNA polymerase primary sigma factor